jgi:hypothetical protein
MYPTLGNIILHATTQGDLELIKGIINQGFNIYTMIDKVFIVALHNHHFHIVDWLFADYTIDSPLIQTLIQAAADHTTKYNNLEGLKYIVDNYGVIEYINLKLLGKALHYNSNNIINYILKF